jgi:hypothetical protein
LINEKRARAREKRDSKKKRREESAAPKRTDWKTEEHFPPLKPKPAFA